MGQSPGRIEKRLLGNCPRLPEGGAAMKNSSLKSVSTGTGAESKNTATCYPSQNDIAQLIAQVATRAPIRFHKRLDWRKRSITINDIEFGHYIQNETHWEYLMLLALAKPKNVAFASRIEGAISGDHMVSNRAKAKNCRRELGRILPPGIVRLLVKAVPGTGHKLAHDVIVRDSGEVGLKYFPGLEYYEGIQDESFDYRCAEDESIDGDERQDSDFESQANGCVAFV